MVEPAACEKRLGAGALISPQMEKTNLYSPLVQDMTRKQRISSVRPVVVLGSRYQL